MPDTRPRRRRRRSALGSSIPALIEVLEPRRVMSIDSVYQVGPMPTNGSMPSTDISSGGMSLTYTPILTGMNTTVTAGSGSTGGTTGTEVPNPLSGMGGTTIYGDLNGGTPSGVTGTDATGTGSTGTGATGTGGDTGNTTAGDDDSSSQDNHKLDLEKLCDWESAVAKSEADYQHAMNSAQNEFDTRLKNINEAADAAQAERDAATAALHAESTARLEQAFAAIKSSTEGAGAARDQRLSALRAGLLEENAETESTYKRETQAAKDEKVATLDAVNQWFLDQTRAIDDAFTTVTEAAQQALDSSLTTIDSTFQSTIDAAEATYAGATQAADAAYASTTEAAWSSLVSSAQGVSTAYEAALTSAAAMRDAVLTGTASSATPVTTNFDSGVIGADLAYQAVIAAAQTAFDGEMTTLVNGYRTAMAAARVGYETAMTAADTAYNGALQTANDNYTTATKDAFDAYNTKIDKAVTLLNTDFNKTTGDAAEEYQKAIGKANEDFDKAIADAQKAYDDLVGPAQTAYEKFKAEEPKTLADQIVAAANGWITSVRDAVKNLPLATNSANSAHLTAVLGAIASLADLSPSNLSTKVADAMKKVDKEAKLASTTYLDTVSAPLGITLPASPTMADYEAYTRAFTNRQRAAVLAYLEAVVGKLISEAETLKSDYKTVVDSTYDAVEKAVEDTAKADETLATDIATATLAIQRAKEVGQAKYMQSLATMQETYFKAAEANEINYRKTLTTAADQQDKAKASAEKARSISKAAAGKAYVDIVADAQKTYVDSYADDWKDLRTSFTDAAKDLAKKLADADKDWVTAANKADEKWVEAAEAAATSYNTAAATASEAAHTAAHTAVNGYVSTVQPAWGAAVNAAYPSAPDAAQYIAAWSGYTAAVVGAWESADGALASLENSYADTVNSATNTHLTSTSTAAHAANKAEVDAAAQALIDATAARRSYDTSYTTAAVTKAKDAVAEDTKKAKDSVAAEQTENDKLASEYESAVHKADDSHEKAVTGANDEIKDATDKFVEGSFKMARELQKASETAANAAADTAIADATAEAKALKDRLIAATKKITAQRKAEAIKTFDSLLNDLRKQLAQLKDNPNADLNPYQVYAGHGTVPFGNLSMMVAPADSLRDTLKQTAQDIRTGLAQSALMTVWMGLPAMPGSRADDLMRQFLNLTNLATAISGETSGVYIGMYDPLSGMVYRNVLKATGSRKQEARSLDAVKSTDAASPLFKEADWIGFFGGISESTADPKSLIHMTLNWVADDAQLAASGGLVDDLLISADASCEIVGLVDPFGIADAIGGVVKLARGDKVGAAISFGSILVPFGADKIAKYATRVPTGSIDDAVAGIGGLAKGAKGQIDDAGRIIADATAKRAETLGKCNGPTCFIAGTKVLMKLEQEPFVVAATNSLTATNDETTLAGGTAAIAIAAGIAAAVAKANVERAERNGNGRTTRRRKRDDDSRTEPALPPPESRQPIVISPCSAVLIPTQNVAPKPKRRWLSNALSAAMLLCFAVAGWNSSQVALNPTGAAYSSPVAPPTGALAAAAANARTRNVTTNIEDVRLGRRVVGRNPLREQTQSPTDINPATHRAVRLEMQQHGALYELAFVRSLNWLDEQHAAPGGTIHLVMTEMGLDGEARVIAIDSCPEIESDDGTGRMIVTGTMKHLATNVLEIEIAAETEPLGVTDTHPIWSEDRHQFVVAGQLRTGERLRQSNGHLTQVTRITPKRGPPVMVYNLEIDGEHVYHVGDNGLLVHNDCGLTDRAARRQAMRDAGIPTSRPAISQSGPPGRRQYVVEGADGRPRIVSQHPPDTQHPLPHWHAAPPKLDPRTGEILTNNHGQIKYLPGGPVVTYGGVQ